MMQQRGPAPSGGRAADTSSAVGPTVCAILKRDRAKTLVRTVLPRRRCQLVSAKTKTDLVDTISTTLIDAVIIDGGLGEELTRILPLAEDYPSTPFFLITPLFAMDTPTVSRAVESGLAELWVEGVDDTHARQLMQQRCFTHRFERAFSVAPDALAITSPIQKLVWQRLVGRAGRSVRTDELARELNISREHLSRSFATGEAPTLKRVIDLVRLFAAAELAKNPGYDLKEVAAVLDFASPSHLSATVHRLIGARSSALARLRAIDILDRFLERQRSAPEEQGSDPDVALPPSPDL
jgi:AraC-like DNA-binding protein